MALGGRRPALVPPRWVPPVSTIICALALVDSAYLAWLHFFHTKSVPYCTTGGLVNCEAVTTSIYSRFLGLPVSALGLAWSVGMLVLCSPPAWRASSPWVGRLRLLGSVTGLGMVFWLLYTELFKLHLICEYCSVVHVLTLALFVVIAYGTALAVPGDLEEAVDEPDVDGPDGAGVSSTGTGPAPSARPAPTVATHP